jgi:hypothetical protein
MNVEQSWQKYNHSNIIIISIAAILRIHHDTPFSHSLLHNILSTTTGTTICSAIHGDTVVRHRYC